MMYSNTLYIILYKTERADSNRRDDWPRAERGSYFVYGFLTREANAQIDVASAHGLCLLACTNMPAKQVQPRFRFAEMMSLTLLAKAKGRDTL